MSIKIKDKVFCIENRLGRSLRRDELSEKSFLEQERKSSLSNVYDYSINFNEEIVRKELIQILV